MKLTKEITQAARLLFGPKGHSPGQLIIQMSDACNATCPQCELRAGSAFKRSAISLDVLKRTIDRAAENGVQALSFTGGEPFLHLDDLVEAIRHAGAAGIPYIRTGTNGFFVRGSEKPGWEKRVSDIVDKLADTPLYTLWFSLDSSDADTHEQMRGLSGVVRGMEKALPIFHERGIYPSANLGINRKVNRNPEATHLASCDAADFYQAYHEGFHAFYRQVHDMGFSVVNACYPMSSDINDDNGLGNVYGAASSDDIVTFSRHEKALIFQAMMDAMGEYRDRLRIFSPRTSLYMMIREYRQQVDSLGNGYRDFGYPCKGGIDYFFIDAQSGETWPCGFRSEDTLGPYTELDMSRIDRDVDCRRCDWECFRDPSELLGPLAELKANPLKLFRGTLSDRIHYRLWRDDLSYYRACDYFNGRQKPDLARMKRFRIQPDHSITNETIGAVASARQASRSVSKQSVEVAV